MNNLTRWERYSPVGIGLEDMFKRLDAFADSSATNWPPYNIIKLDDDNQQLQIALHRLLVFQLSIFQLLHNIAVR